MDLSNRNKDIQNQILLPTHKSNQILNNQLLKAQNHKIKYLIQN
jgi:hypothetical protein